MKVNSLVKNTISYGLGVIASRGISLILLPIYTSYFDSTNYGVIELVTTIIQLFIIFGSFQIETAYQRYYHDDNASKLLITSFVLVTSLSLLISSIPIIFADQIANWIGNNDEIISALYIMPGIILMTNLNVLIQIQLRNTGRVIVFNVLTVIQVFFSATYTIAALRYCSVNIVHIFIGQFIGLLIYNILSLRYYYPKLKSEINFNKITAILLMDYAMPQMPARILSFINTYANRFFVALLLTTHDVGILSVAIKISSIVMLAYQAFVMSWGPYIFRKDFNNSDTLRGLEKLFNYSLIFITTISLFFVFFANDLQSMLSSGEYASSSKILAGFAFANALFLIKEIVDIGPKIKRKTIYISYSYMVSTIIGLISLVVFLPLFGLVATMISMIVSNLALVMTSWYYTEKLLDLRFNRLYFTLSISIILICIYIKY